MTTTTPATASLSRSAWTHPTARPFAILGTVAIVGGSLLSAALAPTASYHSSWAVAYIVLVAGVAQVALGVGQTAVTDGRVSVGTVTVQAVLWNLGAIATVAATIGDIPVLLYLASAAQAATIVLFLVATRHGRSGVTLLTLRVLSALLLVSIPTGIVLQAITH